MAVPAGRPGLRRARQGRGADRRRRDHRRPGHPVPLGAGSREDPRLGRAAHLRGEGHTAYSADHTCIAKAVGSYLVDGDVPADDTTCS
ncbi:alpha/beta hydrolase [Luteimicrobium album]|uniref:alpha/beta hydrolase n=1 Tax=Luteimicrobium album TaxID=1054550 RepID=UPI0024E09D89|nr:alpha/beta hydrolase [Luteimicrobium album]